MTRSYQIETSNSLSNTGSFINDYIHSEGITCQVVHEGYSSWITENETPTPLTSLILSANAWADKSILTCTHTLSKPETPTNSYSKD